MEASIEIRLKNDYRVCGKKIIFVNNKLSLSFTIRLERKAHSKLYFDMRNLGPSFYSPEIKIQKPALIKIN